MKHILFRLKCFIIRLVDQTGIRKFRGGKIKVLNIRASQWDGIGITVLSVQWNYKGKICTLSGSRALFFFNLSMDYSNGGKVLRFRAGIFFVYKELWNKVIKPPKDRCNVCGDLCDTKEFYIEDVPCCSEDCEFIENNS